MKTTLTILFVLACLTPFCQNKEHFHDKNLMIGFGPSYVGYNAKIGAFLKNNILLLGYYERQYFLADAFDYGLGLRKYYGKSKHKVYLQPSLSYGTYKAWNWNTPPLPMGENKIEKTPKISGVAGFELSLGKNLNANVELGYGYYSTLAFGRLISRASLNYIINKKGKPIQLLK